MASAAPATAQDPNDIDAQNQADIYRGTPRQIREWIVDCIEAGLVPFTQSSPGMGKSSLYRSVARQFGLCMVDHRLSTSQPVDFAGLPEFYTDEDGNRRARFVPFDTFPIEGTRIPKGFEGWMLFLDEANSGTKMTQAASYKLILDKMVGQLNLHANVAIGAAGNLSTDRAIVQALSTALQSRLINLEMQLDFREFMEDVALPQKWDQRVVAFLNWKGINYLMDFRPDHQEKTFACPRTWDFMQLLIRGKEVTREKIGLYAGTVTSGKAVEFATFCEIWKNGLVTMKDVMRDPDGAPVPNQSNAKWATVSHLMNEVDQTTFNDVARYMDRYDLGFRALFFRGLVHTQPKLRAHPKFGASMLQVSQYLDGQLNAQPQSSTAP